MIPDKGMFWPSVASIWSSWAPPFERARLAGLANTGAWVGNIVALPFAGYLCTYGFDGGWPSIFYIFGNLLKIEIYHFIFGICIFIMKMKMFPSFLYMLM